MIVYFTGLIASLLNCLIAAYEHNISATLGWVCSCIWLISLLMKENKK